MKRSQVTCTLVLGLVLMSVWTQPNSRLAGVPTSDASGLVGAGLYTGWMPLLSASRQCQSAVIFILKHLYSWQCYCATYLPDWKFRKDGRLIKLWGNERVLMCSARSQILRNVGPRESLSSAFTARRFVRIIRRLKKRRSVKKMLCP